MNKIAVWILAGAILGAGITHVIDARQIANAQQNEMQANGLEDQCKATLKAVQQ